MAEAGAEQQLEALRGALDAIDEAILDRLAERRAVVEQVLALKDGAGRALRDPGREAAMRAALIEKGCARGLDATLVEALFDRVIADSVRLQAGLLVRRRNAGVFEGPLVIGYHGAPGSYSERAARAHFGPIAAGATYRGFETLRDVVASVERGEARFGVLPIENTTAGSINETYDLLAAAALSIVGEAVAPVEHCLAGVAEVPLSSLKKIYSHPMALVQCQDFLATLPGASPEPYYNTALAARKVKEEDDPTHAAVVSAEAAATYGLVVLRERIADRADNLTRFADALRTRVLGEGGDRHAGKRLDGEDGARVPLAGELDRLFGGSAPRPPEDGRDCGCTSSGSRGRCRPENIGK